MKNEKLYRELHEEIERELNEKIYRILLQDILRVLNTKLDVKLGEKNELVIKEFNGNDIVSIDLSKQIQDQDNEVLAKLIDLIK